MKQSVRAWEFQSKYLRDFAVVEERHNGLCLFPATEQLPLLSRAIDEEFKAGLTTRLAATDGRGDSWRKLQLWKASTAFCSFLNSGRPDHLHVQPFYTPEFVTQIAVVQHITKAEAGGNRHWFRAFRGDAFLPDIYLSGKRVTFASHAIDRYAQRTLTFHAHPAIMLVTEFFHTVVAVVQLNGDRPAFAIEAGGTVAVLPYVETATEYLILTTLSPHEVTHLAPLVPPRRLHLHYGPTYTPPTAANFDLNKRTMKLLAYWQTKQPHTDRDKLMENIRASSWTRLVQSVDHVLHVAGHTAGTRMLFHDDIYGPTIVTRNPQPIVPRPESSVPGPKS